MKFDIISIFPEFFSEPLRYGIIGRAFREKIINVELINPRDFTDNARRTVDDRPYGGGPGMVMMAEPLVKAIESIPSSPSISKRVIYLSPQGKRFSQKDVEHFTAYNEVVLLCGRYEGIDERVIRTYVDEEWSIGDYVLSGGELPALVLLDAITRTLPGVVHTSSSIDEESFMHNDLLDYPQYTRPPNFRGQSVPNVLLSGNHAKIQQWREMMSLLATKVKRPDILDNLALTDDQIELLNKIENDQLFLEEIIK